MLNEKELKNTFEVYYRQSKLPALPLIQNIYGDYTFEEVNNHYKTFRAGYFTDRYREYGG